MEGHNGIYEVSVGDDVLYINRSACSQGFPTDELIFERLGSFLGIELRAKPVPANEAGVSQGPACSSGDGPKGEQGKVTLTPHPSQQLNAGGGCGCGCSPPVPTSSDGSGCC